MMNEDFISGNQGP